MAIKINVATTEKPPELEGNTISIEIKEEIDAYEDRINAIAEEKPGEAISGANKFWAVIAAALGAGAASITGTPNFPCRSLTKPLMITWKSLKPIVILESNLQNASS